MTTHSAEEVQANYVECLGEELGSKLYWLSNAVTNLHLEWKLYKELFCSGSERVGELNKASGLVSFFLSKTLYESVVLGISRVTDPAETGRGVGAKPNLSLLQLKSELPPELQTEYEELCSQAKDKAEFARDARNKMIAHADLWVATKERPVDAGTPTKVDVALEAIRDAISFIDHNLRNTTVIYDDFCGPLDNHMSFLRSLYLGNLKWSQHLAAIKAAQKKCDWKKVDELDSSIDLPGWIYGEN
ncbi:hypothetical protein [Leisingera sp.]|uniref:AbiU2 domain-containing protein n=1 Tax=Leisingera sp. TaxID=1879318 RepID=UPI002B27574D|nr:hypothetical protein [Leisingera sp.]